MSVVHPDDLITKHNRWQFYPRENATMICYSSQQKSLVIATNYRKGSFLQVNCLLTMLFFIDIKPFAEAKDEKHACALEQLAYLGNEIIT